VEKELLYNSHMLQLVHSRVVATSARPYGKCRYGKCILYALMSLP